MRSLDVSVEASESGVGGLSKMEASSAENRNQMRKRPRTGGLVADGGGAGGGMGFSLADTTERAGSSSTRCQVGASIPSPAERTGSSFGREASEISMTQSPSRGSSSSWW